MDPLLAIQDILATAKTLGVDQWMVTLDCNVPGDWQISVTDCSARSSERVINESLTESTVEKFRGLVMSAGAKRLEGLETELAARANEVKVIKAVLATPRVTSPGWLALRPGQHKALTVWWWYLRSPTGEEHRFIAREELLAYATKFNIVCTWTSRFGDTWQVFEPSEDKQFTRCWVARKDGIVQLATGTREEMVENAKFFLVTLVFKKFNRKARACTPDEDYIYRMSCGWQPNRWTARNDDGTAIFSAATKDELVKKAEANNVNLLWSTPT